MIFLFDPISLITPDLGYVFWTTLAFVGFWFLIGKFAVRPIQNSIESRNKSIEDSLAQAEIARREIATMQAKNEDLLKEAREERTRIMNEAKATADKFRAEQIERAKADAAKLLNDAKTEIDNQKKQAMTEVKNEVGKLALEISEKIIRQQLSNDAAQQELVKKMVAELN
ncbi:MAG: F0F1 ATP synthase subunit B [Bacteroidetes bacterium]|nr:F0F1 ATP synthase subunit B [Bacteroidota bacterium]